MSASCNDHCSLDTSRNSQRKTLYIVLVINVVMFVVMVIASQYGNTSALFADSLDNLGDALTYGLSLYAVSRGATVKARVALFKGIMILLGALTVAGHVIYKLVHSEMPVFEIMGVFSLLGLLGNSVCLWLLWRHRDEDINMRSVWECSRNDLASNISVLLAALAVWATSSGWPDTVIALILIYFLTASAIRVIRSSLTELHSRRTST